MAPAREMPGAKRSGEGAARRRAKAGQQRRQAEAGAAQQVKQEQSGRARAEAPAKARERSLRKDRAQALAQRKTEKPFWQVKTLEQMTAQEWEGSANARERSLRKDRAQALAQRKTERPFWRVKTLEQMTAQEWEALCDGCGLCCLHKIEEEDTGAIYETSVVCELLDCQSCRCRDYANRRKIVPDCIQLTREKIAELPWLPKSCAYRLLAAGKKLKPWHYLISGSRETVHEAGISARGKIKTCETELAEPEDYIPYITQRVA